MSSAANPPWREPFIQLAPMEGVLDWILRDLLSEVGGVDRMVTEFVRVTDRLLPAHVFHRFSPELANGGRTRSGTPVFVQLLGGKPEYLAENAARAVELGAPGIDLNFGCPAKTVNRHDGGAVLLRDPDRLLRIVTAVRQAVPANIPVTAKVRLGCEHKDFHREIAAAVDAGGAETLVVHARTKVEMYTPPAHWHYIRSMRESNVLGVSTSRATGIRYVANGEIWNSEDYFRCVEASGVVDVALGRGIVRRPTLAVEIRRALPVGSIKKTQSETKKIQSAPMPPPKFVAGDFLLRFFRMSRDARGAQFAVARTKQLLRYWQSYPDKHGSWQADLPYQKLFNQVKVLHEEIAVEDLILRFFEKTAEIKMEDPQWHPYNSTLGPIAPSACAPKIS